MENSIFEQIREIPSFCKVAKNGKVYLRYLDSPLNDDSTRKGIVYVGCVTEDGKMLTEEAFFKWCEKTEETEAAFAERERHWTEMRKAWEEEEERRKAEKKKQLLENTEFHTSPGLTIFQERLLDKTGINAILHDLFDDYTAASLKQIAVNFVYHGDKAFLDHTGMYGTCYPPECFPYLRANQTVNVLNQAGEKAEEFFKACLKANDKKELLAMQIKSKLTIYKSDRSSRSAWDPFFGGRFFEEFTNPLEPGIDFYRRGTILLDRQTQYPVTIIPDESKIFNPLKKIIADAEKKSGRSLMLLRGYSHDHLDELEELANKNRKFAVTLTMSEPEAQAVLKEYRDTLLENGVVTFNNCRCRKFEMNFRNVSGWGFIGCRETDREWIISEADQRIASAKNRYIKAMGGYDEYLHLFDIKYNEDEDEREVHLIKGGKKQFVYEAGYFVVFTNDPAMTEEEAVRWFYTEDDIDACMSRRIMNYVEGNELHKRFDADGMIVAYFLASVLHTEIEKLLGRYINEEDITISNVIDRLNAVTVRILHGEYYLSEWDEEAWVKYSPLMQAADITQEDLLNYAKRVMADLEYFHYDDDDW